MRKRVIWAANLALVATGAWAQQAPSLYDQPAAAPTITYADTRLTIEAANSSLRTILANLETLTGVKINGITKDERIFGVYGPGNPQEVLSSLLDDSGYNIIISGRKNDGSPREIVLTARSAAPASVQAAPVTQAAQEDDENDAGEQTAPPPPPPGFFGMPQGGSTQGQQQPPPQGQQQPQGQQPPQGQQNGPQNGQSQPVRTPQQMLEELQRLRQNQQPQQQQQPPQ